ncbi:integrase core domain-containing protein [Cellvibrio japonicus]|nr:integrase core domain-containing protein [Cellvibrio japonicus]QEI12896.1 DDE-type integrase/transposase/recombinase [Cellvibrio japonicus]QEI16470.1 DDE-type integrase/transposase/recombinase [Cellvibrio japonicus]QEI20048.1 DDE-type integrase/transposase/recombinase [Cellvibrio japonicus]
MVTIALLLFILLNAISRFIHLRQQRHFFKSKPQNNTTEHIPTGKQRKPDWVKQEIIRLKAFMIHDGGRKIADTFNRLYADKRQMTVGKTFVYNTIQKHRYDIRVLRKKIKNKKPRTLPRNFVWSMDLTRITDNQHQPHNVFGIIDSGTRACLYLDKVQTKASITLLRCLLDTIENLGKPRAIRTDNEAVFTSRLFRFGLWILNIKHQRTEVCCPWMNGKIERFFGTLKRKLQHYTIHSAETVANDLAVYRFWYNHIRTHQYLNGRTPAEAWGKQTLNLNNQPIGFSAWDSALTGYYLPPS